MSKQIKQMEMDALKATFNGIRDMVLLSVSGLTCQADNQLRLGLRKKNIRLQLVKNSLARRVFNELGLKSGYLQDGPTLVAWGAGSLSELSRELETVLKKNEKQMKVKGALSEGQQVTFKQALAMPTRAEAAGRVLMLALAPARRVAGQIRGPAGKVAGQVKAIGEKKPEEAAAPAAG
jgi:large subunit ribosomal protein L10